MHIQSIEIENYKCFWEPRKIRLERGFNLFVGANNSGKTTVLETLDLAPVISEPHRSVKNIPAFGGGTSGQSKCVVTLATDIDELGRVAAGVGGELYVPLPQGSLDAAEVVAPRVRASPIMMEIELGGVGNLSAIYETALGKSTSITASRPNEKLRALYLNSDTSPIITNHGGGIVSVVASYCVQYRQFIYRFSAQRIPGGECSNTGAPTLDREAKNSVLHQSFAIK